MDFSTLSKSSTVRLRDGHMSPVFGLGVFQDVFPGDAHKVALKAIQCGYKKLDTSPLYRNEEAIGAAIKRSGIAREDIYLVTKVWNDNHGREGTIRGLNESLSKLGVEYIDRYLIQSVIPQKQVVETWDTMIELQKQGLVKSIGVATFNEDHLKELKKARPDYIPPVNQLEATLAKQRIEIVEYCREEGIMIETALPLCRGYRIDRYKLTEVAQRYNKSVHQLMIRWCLQSGFMALPKTRRPEKVEEYGDVFDFHLTQEDMVAISQFNNERIHEGWDALTASWDGSVDVSDWLKYITLK